MTPSGSRKKQKELAEYFPRLDKIDLEGKGPAAVAVGPFRFWNCPLSVRDYSDVGQNRTITLLESERIK